MIEYTLRQLEVFTAATEQESLTRAADQLHLTQSTASTHLRSLEQCLGTTLLLRRGQGGVTLTEDGQRLYPWLKDTGPVSGPGGRRRRSPAACLPAAFAGGIHRAGAVYAANAHGRLLPKASPISLRAAPW